MLLKPKQRKYGETQATNRAHAYCSSNQNQGNMPKLKQRMELLLILLLNPKPRKYVAPQATNGVHAYCSSKPNHGKMWKLKQRMELLLTAPQPQTKEICGTSSNEWSSCLLLLKPKPTKNVAPQATNGAYAYCSSNPNQGNMWHLK